MHKKTAADERSEDSKKCPKNFTNRKLQNGTNYCQKQQLLFENWRKHLIVCIAFLSVLESRVIFCP